MTCLRTLLCVLLAACDGMPTSRASLPTEAEPDAALAALDDAGQPPEHDADVGRSDAGEPEAPAEPAPERGMWLKGDLHVHSENSTDAQDSPVAEVIARAEELGFDYLAFTDHDNHVEGNITTWSDPGHASSELLLLYGVEWTSGLGHANLFSPAPWDHPSVYALRDGPGADSIAAAHAEGVHFSVNHPAAKDLWEHGFELDYDSMEVWTAVFLVPNSNDKAIELWDDVLLGGRRMTARGGSDSHHQHDAESLLFNIGNPTTWVRAREQTPEGVIEALKRGRVSVSYAPDGERVELTADRDGDGVFEALMGDSLPADGTDLTFQIEIAGFRPGASYDVTVIKNGEAFMSLSLQTPSVTFGDTPDAEARTYYRLEVRGDTPEAPPLSALGFGRFVALSNPIYVGFP